MFFHSCLRVLIYVFLSIFLVPYLFSLYRLPFSTLSTVFDAILSNIDECSLNQPIC